MVHRYRPHGEAVAAFLDEVRATEKDGWRAYAGRARPSRAEVDAVVALTTVRLAGPVRTAVHSAALAAFRSLDLDAADLPGGARISVVAGGIKSGAIAVAAGEALDAQHRQALLGPFAEAGFVSVAGSLPSGERS